MKSKKKVKRKLKFRGLILIIFFLFLISLFIYYLWTLPIKKITIEGNTYLKDNEIISLLPTKNNSVLSISRRKIKKTLLDLEIISEVKIHKNYFGTLKITVKEENILFYNLNTQKVILSNGKEVPYQDTFLGVPTLINFVPQDIYEELVEKLKTINLEVLNKVSEIEYSPSKINDKIIDDKRFLFRMNDGNIVYINTINIEKFNNYLEIYEVIANKNNGEVKGCLYLDSNSENNHFNKCEEEVVTPPEGEEPNE